MIYFFIKWYREFLSSYIITNFQRNGTTYVFNLWILQFIVGMMSDEQHRQLLSYYL